MGSDVTFSQAQSAALPALPPHAPGVAVLTRYARRKKKKPAVLPTRRASLRPTLGDARRDGEDSPPDQR